MRHPSEERHRQQHDEDEHDERGVQRREQLEQVHEDADPHVTHGVRDRRADADRREQHDDIRELEHRLGERLAEDEQRTSSRLGQQGERDAEQHAEDDDLQHFAVGYRSRDVVGNGVENDILPRLRRRRAIASPGGRQVAA